VPRPLLFKLLLLLGAAYKSNPPSSTDPYESVKATEDPRSSRGASIGEKGPLLGEVSVYRVMTEKR
jgi:hypothetical protein